MAVEDEVIEPQDVIDTPEVQEEQPQDPPENQEQDEAEGYTFADSPPQEQEQESDSSVIRELRKRHREMQKELQELKARAVEPEKPKLDPKPTLEGCDFDAEAFETKLANWYEQKRKVEESEAEVRKEQEAQQKEWEQKRQTYDDAKRKFPMADFEDAEDTVKAFLSETQQGILLHVADKPERLVYALGKNPSKAKELAGIKDPLKLAVAIAKLESSVVSKKTAPPPERTVRSGGGASPAATDREYEARLQQIMEKGGDLSELRRLRKSKPQ